ncbi:MAG: VanZ family protein [Defluviitaleaceae bacterium]|nr:VanZ family protein [Defluviitaleaceae bacterium]
MILTIPFIFYLLSVFELVFTPIDIFVDLELRDEFIRGFLQQETWGWWDIATVNLIPFRSLIRTLSASLFLWRFTLRAVVGNFILLLPLPILIGLLSKKELTLKKAVLIGFGSSLFIESTQLLINTLTGWPNRLACVDDLLLNTLGAIVGYFIYKKYHRFFEKIISLFYQFLTWS